MSFSSPLPFVVRAEWERGCPKGRGEGPERRLVDSLLYIMVKYYKIMGLYKVEAVNIKSSRFGEADKIMVLFTRSHGKVHAIAKSAYKTSSKFGGRLELFAHNNFLLAKGKSLDIVSQIETIKTYHRIRENESKLKAALYMMKVLYYFLEDNAKNEPLFDMLVESLSMLDNEVPPNIVSRMFDVKFLDIEGLLPFCNFQKEVQPCIRYLKEGSFNSNIFSNDDLQCVDLAVLPIISEHVGKDVSFWKSL